MLKAYIHLDVHCFFHYFWYAKIHVKIAVLQLEGIFGIYILRNRMCKLFK